MKKMYSYGVSKTWDGKWMLVYHSSGNILHFVETRKDFEDAYKAAVAYNNNRPDRVFIEKK